MCFPLFSFKKHGLTVFAKKPLKFYTFTVEILYFFRFFYKKIAKKSNEILF